MCPYSFVMKSFKIIINNDVCELLLCNFKEVGRCSLYVSACEYHHESLSETENKKGYSFLYSSICISYINTVQWHHRLLGLSPLLSLPSSPLLTKLLA